VVASVRGGREPVPTTRCAVAR